MIDWSPYVAYHYSTPYVVGTILSINNKIRDKFIIQHYYSYHPLPLSLSSLSSVIFSTYTTTSPPATKHNHHQSLSLSSKKCLLSLESTLWHRETSSATTLSVYPTNKISLQLIRERKGRSRSADGEVKTVPVSENPDIAPKKGSGRVGNTDWNTEENVIDLTWTKRRTTIGDARQEGRR